MKQATRILVLSDVEWLACPPTSFSNKIGSMNFFYIGKLFAGLAIERSAHVGIAEKCSYSSCMGE